MHTLPLALCFTLLAALLSPAFASGREGEAMVGAVLWIIAIVGIPLVVLPAAGAVVGAFRSRQEGESMLRGTAHGALKGLLAFVVLGTITMVILTVLGVLWVAYSLVTAY